jgi:hypothetical protein
VREDFAQFSTVTDSNRGPSAEPSERIPDPYGLLCGTWVPGEPIEFTLGRKGDPKDMLLGGPPSVCLVSDAFVATVHGVGASGWTTYPITLRRRDGEVIPGYQGLSIVGRAGRPSYADSELFMGRPFTGGPAVPMVRGMGFDLASWDGSDVFLLDTTAHVIATASVRTALRRAKVRNVSFERLSEKTSWSASIGIGGARSRPGVTVRLAVDPAAHRPVEAHQHVDVWLERRITPDELPFLYGAILFPEDDAPIVPGSSGLARLVPDIAELFPSLPVGTAFEIIERDVVNRGVVVARPT